MNNKSIVRVILAAGFLGICFGLYASKDIILGAIPGTKADTYSPDQLAEIKEMNTRYDLLKKESIRFDVVRPEDFCEVYEHYQKVGGFASRYARTQGHQETPGFPVRYEKDLYSPVKEKVADDGYILMKAGKSISCVSSERSEVYIIEQIHDIVHDRVSGEYRLTLLERTLPPGYDPEVFRRAYIRAVKPEIAKMIAKLREDHKAFAGLYEIMRPQAADSINPAIKDEEKLKEQLAHSIKEWHLSLKDLNVPPRVTASLHK